MSKDSFAGLADSLASFGLAQKTNSAPLNTLKGMGPPGGAPRPAAPAAASSDWGFPSGGSHQPAGGFGVGGAGPAGSGFSGFGFGGPSAAAAAKPPASPMGGMGGLGGMGGMGMGGGGMVGGVQIARGGLDALDPFSGFGGARASAPLNTAPMRPAGGGAGAPMAPHGAAPHSAPPPPPPPPPQARPPPMSFDMGGFGMGGVGGAAASPAFPGGGLGASSGLDFFGISTPPGGGAAAPSPAPSASGGGGVPDLMDDFFGGSSSGKGAGSAGGSAAGAGSATAAAAAAAVNLDDIFGGGGVPSGGSGGGFPPPPPPPPRAAAAAAGAPAGPPSPGGAAPAAAPLSAAAAMDDFFGFAQAQAAPAPPKAPSLDDLLNVGAAASRAAASVSLDDLMGFGAPSPGGAGGSTGGAPTPAAAEARAEMHDLFGTGPPATLVEEVFEEIPNEPPRRRELRFARFEEKRGRMRAKLDAQRAQEAAAAAAQAARHQSELAVGDRVTKWEKANRNNMRTALASCHSVLWEGCGWKPLGISDLITYDDVKKAWRRAVVIIHPDKVTQKGGTPEQAYIASLVFDVLKEAWNKFESEEKGAAARPAGANLPAGFKF